MAQTEICDNGIDDDGDGLIDCYDDDCSGVGECVGFFFGQPEADCNYVPPELDEIELNLLFKTDESRYPVDQRAGVVVGDLDGDGIAELVSRDNGPPRIQIFDGATGEIKQSILTPNTHPFGQLAIADVDEDGLGDIFHVEYDGVLARYEFGNPDAVWRTNAFVGDDNSVSTPQIADINQDGVPEVYVGDRIFNAITGERYIDGGNNINVGGYATGGNSDRFPIYYDLFQPGDPKPDGSGNFGPEAAGMEYIAGNQVWTVTFDPAGGMDNGNFQLAAQYSGPTNERDGLTSIGDINGDGRMDIAVMDAGRVYAWDPYTNERIGPAFDVPGTGSGGRINIGDFDGDGDVELGFAGRDIYIVRDYSGSGGDNNGTWSTLWQKTGLDDGSQRTGSTLFDFDGNGTVEVVYSEEENLFIYDGPTGMELFRIISRSGTRTEYPIVADVNGDGTAEIVVTAQERNGPQFSGTGWISVYESANQPWVPARDVWNQHGYNVTNINDDLTVPQFQQNNLEPALGQRYNNFLVQTSVGGGADGEIRYPAPDAIIMAELDVNGDPVIDFSDCPNTITISLQVDNEGSAPLPAATPISFYDGDPSTTSPNLITTTVLGAQVNAGETRIVPVTIDVSQVPAGSPIWLSVNDPGFAAADLPFEESDFPLTGTAECDYTNNVSNVGNVRCGEVCDNGTDDDGDGLVDEPNLVQTQSTGCPGDVLNPITNDSPGGTYSVLGGSSIGTTVDQNGVVTLGDNFTGAPVTETIRYDDGICTEEVTVTTVDDVPPTIACPGDQRVNVDANCEAFPTDYSAATQVSDNCSAVGDINIEQDALAGFPFSLGPNVVTMTATDRSGNQSSCTFTVTAADNANPAITCPADEVVALDANCQYTIPDLTAGASVSDNCSAAADITLAQTPVQGEVRSNDGTNVLVTLTATDEAGNAANCTYTLTLEDATPPVITCPTVDDQTLSNMPDACAFTLFDYRGQVQRQDNCSGFNQITLTQSPAPGTPITEPGTTTITITATDAAGNETTCTFDQVVLDRDPPQLICGQFAPIAPNTGSCDYTVPDVIAASTITDNCGSGVPPLTVTQSPAAGTTFTGFFQNVTVTATDASGNSNICVTTLLPGPNPPATIDCPADQSLTADGDCAVPLPDYTSLATTDGCGTITVSQTPGPGTPVSNATTVTLTARNTEGVATSCTFSVEVVDNTPPTIVCPATQTIAVDGTCEVPLPDYTGAASAADNCDPAKGGVTVAQLPAAGTMYDINDSPVTVTLTATDVSGNVANCTFQVELMDNQPPMISCPVSPQTDQLDASCNTTIPDFRTQTMVSSTCSMSGFTLTQVPAPGTVVTGEQTVPITITADDGQGNTVSCTFNYETEDVTAPTITCPAPPTESLDANCAFMLPDYTGLATVADNCSSLAPAPAPNLTVTQSLAPGTVVTGDGTVTPITVTVTDAAGNAASCTFNLTTEDDTPPVPTCPPTQNEVLDDNCAFNVGDYTTLVTATDNCTAPGSFIVTQSPAPTVLTVNGPETVTLTMTVSDVAGNQADCSFDVVITDATSPTIVCPSNPVLDLDGDCQATVPDLTGDAVLADNCSALSAVTVAQDVTPGTVISGDGTTQAVVLTATDGAGLTANCTVTITLDDVTPPAITCPAAQDQDLDPTGCQVALADFSGLLTSEDNCTASTALTIQQMPAPGTIVMGADAVQTVTFDVNDGNGNTASCNFTVTLRDVTEPVVNCPPPATLTLDANCSVPLPDYTGLATATDDCAMTADFTFIQSPAAGTNLTFDGATTIVTITAEDGNGNLSNCSFTVTAEDTSPPAISCPAAREEAVSANCDFELPDYTGGAAVMDNCSEVAAISISQSPAVGTIIPESQLNLPQTITLTATDAAGNSQSCTFEITPVDRADPSIVCPVAQTILLDATNCEAPLGDYTGLATPLDNCTDAASIIVTQDIAPGTVYGGLTPPSITVTLTAEDESGNTADCAFNVFIIDDVDPTVDCSAANQTVALDENCNGELPDLIPDLITDDNCSAIALTVQQNPPLGSAYGGDGTVVPVTFTVTDASGNTVTCMATITFEDQSPPNPVVCPTDQELNVDDVCDVPLPDYTGGATVLDNCRAQEDIVITQSPAPETMVNIVDNPTVTVTLTADDGNGNTETCDFVVTLVDEQALDLTCPGGQLVIASGDNCDGVLPDYVADVVAVNQCMVPAGGASLTQMPPAGTLLTRPDLDVPQTVTINATDVNGNTSQCTFLVTLVDTLPPVISCPAPQTDTVRAACEYVFEDLRSLATITDNCAAGAELDITQSPTIGTALTGPDLQRTVTITATDPSGNRSQCSFTLTISDITVPALVCPEPDTVLTNGDCEITIGDYTSSTLATDNCTAKEDLILSQVAPPGTVIAGHLATETVTITATDASGNSANCTFTVTAKDETPPMITCPGDRIVRPDADCNALVPDYRKDAVVTDNCTNTFGVGGISITQRPAPGTVLSGEGDARQVTLVADDGNGNLDSCTFIVRLEDNTPPTIDCPADETIALDADCEYDLENLTTEADVLDNCTAAADILVTQNVGIGQTFSGDGTEIAVTLTADDGNGNTAQCVTRIMLRDTTPPTIICPADQEIALDASCEALVPDYRSATVEDNCTVPAAIAVIQSPAPGTSFGGANSTRTITLTADDGNGNTTSCSFELRVIDNTPPTITCPPDQEIFVDGNCTEVLPNYVALATVMDNCNPASTVTQNSPAGTLINSLGVRTVTLTANDGNGNTTSCTFTLDVKDNTPPELSCPPLSVMAADPNCVVTIADYRDSIMVSDNCGPASAQMGALTLVQSPLPGATISGLNATQSVAITATDPSGNVSQCAITVELADTTRPTIVCPNDTTLAVDANCGAIIPDYTTLPVVMDNCEASGPVTVTQSPIAGTVVSDEASLITVTLTATDASGNAISCDFGVQLIDSIPPSVTCPADDVISVDGTCEILLPDYRPNAGPVDNCSDPAAITLAQRPAPGTPLSGDGTVLEVTIIATDESGNVDSCQMTVTLEDSTQPMINCPADQELAADDDCAVPIPDYTGEASASSTCDQSMITITQQPAPGTVISGHNATETITLTATDASGNSVSCSFTVRLLDRVPPVITACQNDTTGVLTDACDYTLPDYWNIGPATAQDNCRPTGTTATSATGDQIVYTQSPPPGTVLADAFTVTTITLTADDGNGNTVSCDFELTLIDTTPPAITCPTDTIANPDAACDFTLEDYRARAPVADNCADAADLVVTQSPAPGTVISGQAFSQDITLTVTDPSGNSTSCTFNLMLQDTISPTIDCPADKIENLSATCDFTVPDYTGEAVTDDNCTAPAAIVVSQSPAAGTLITDQNEGDEFTVTLTADDGNGNTTSCDFLVTLDDIIPPVLNCPADSTIFVDASCEAPLPDLLAVTTATDNCATATGGSGITIEQSPLPALVFAGDNTQVPVSLTAEDGNGNTSSCVVTVTLQDTISPMIDCPADEVLLTDGNCEVLLPDYRPRATISDNCTASADITVSQDITPRTVFSGEGTSQVITLTADDGNGNTTSCTLEITVDDNVPPTIECPGTQTQFTDGNCQVAIDDYTSLAITGDNCTDMAAITVTQSPAPGTVFTGVQNVIVMLTADDGNGNTTSCDFTFFVRDNTAPVVVCPPTQQEIADANCVATIGDYTGLATATDNCSTFGDANGNGITLTQNPPAGTTITGFDQAITVTITATDSSGNFSSCDFQVELIDTEAPTVNCPAPQTLFADANCNTALEDYRDLAVAMDNCDDPNTDLIYVQTPAAGFPLSGDGTSQQVTIGVTDRSGNDVSCVFTVSVRDTVSPTIICPDKDTLSVDQSCPVALPDYTDQATVADNCTDGAAITVSQVPAPGTEFSGDGTIIDVTLTADDGNGNTTSCTFQVELEDQTEPVITCPGRQVLMTDGSCEAVVPDYRSLANVVTQCDNASAITLTQDPAPGTLTISGDSTVQQVTITATDDAVPPNSVSCTFEVILVDDTDPVITVCPSSETVYLDANCEAMLPDFRANLMGMDNCEAFVDMRVAQTPVPGELFRNDDTEVIVTYTLDDTNGNTVNCTATVTFQDTISPMITCPTDQIIFTDANCAAALPDYTDAAVSDNCTSQPGLVTTQVPAAGDVLSGFNDSRLVTLTVDDGNGQTTSCSFTVTLDDDDVPEITCPNPQEIDFGTDCQFVLPDYRSLALLDDNCGPELLTVVQSPSPDSILNDLNTSVEVSLTVTDASDNRARCVFTVTTVSDDPPPASGTVMLAVVNRPTGSGTVNLEDAFDNMAISNLSNTDLDRMLNPGFDPFLVTYYLTMEDADAEVRAIPAENFDPAVSGEVVLARIEDPASGCFTLSQILIEPREPGISDATDVVQCNKPGTSVKIDGRPQAGGQGTTIVRHEWRIVSPGTTRIKDANVMQTDQQVLMVNTSGLRSGTIIFEYQFFEDYGDGALVPSVPKRIELELQNVGGGNFFWDGN